MTGVLLTENSANLSPLRHSWTADVPAAVSVLATRPQLDPPMLDFSHTLLGLDHADLSNADLHRTAPRTD